MKFFVLGEYIGMSHYTLYIYALIYYEYKHYYLYRVYILIFFYYVRKNIEAYILDISLSVLNVYILNHPHIRHNMF